MSNDFNERAVVPSSRKDLRETITRAHLRDAVYKLLPQISRAEAARLVDEVFEEICHALIDGEDVRLRGFGAFRVIKKSVRIGRNPKTGESAMIAARRVISFSASPNCRARVNGKSVTDEEE